MKIKKIKTEFVDADVEDIVDSIFDCTEDFDYRDSWEDSLGVFKDSIDSEEYELSEEEKKDVLTACEKRFYENANRHRNEEINQLDTREKILDLIRFFTHNAWPDEIGYILTPEEILDLIVKNYKN